jgi:hypothetical protein
MEGSLTVAKKESRLAMFVFVYVTMESVTI